MGRCLKPGAGGFWKQCGSVDRDEGKNLSGLSVIEDPSPRAREGVSESQPGAERRGIQVRAGQMMRSGIQSRLKTLEARLLEPSELRKALLPIWLTEELVKQGVRSDASGYPEKIGMESGFELQRLGCM